MVKDKSAYKHVRISLELWRRTKVACVGVEEGIGAFAERAIEERLRGMVEGSISGGRKVVEVGWKPPASLPSKVIVKEEPVVAPGGDRLADAVGLAEATFAPALESDLEDFGSRLEASQRRQAEHNVSRGFAPEAFGDSFPPRPVVETEVEPVPPSEPTLSPYDYCYLCRQVMMPGEVVAVRPGGRAHRRCQAVVDLTTTNSGLPQDPIASHEDATPRVDVGPTKDELF